MYINMFENCEGLDNKSKLSTLSTVHTVQTVTYSMQTTCKLLMTVILSLEPFDCLLLLSSTSEFLNVLCDNTHTTFTALFPYHPGEPVPGENPIRFMVQGKINRGRHTDQPAGRHSIRTNQCPPPPSTIFTSDAFPV